jgi:hypothetical protein
MAQRFASNVMRARPRAVTAARLSMPVIRETMASTDASSDAGSAAVVGLRLSSLATGASRNDDSGMARAPVSDGRTDRE